MRIYIESTIPSYLVARPARDLLQAARQQLTRDWWDLKREHHELFTSQVVLDEIAFGEKAMAQLRVELLQSVPLLSVTEEVKEFAGKVLASGLLPATANRDAVHIALVSAYEMDILLSWNCWHIANAAIQARLRKLADATGAGVAAGTGRGASPPVRRQRLKSADQRKQHPLGHRKQRRRWKRGAQSRCKTVQNESSHPAPREKHPLKSGAHCFHQNSHHPNWLSSKTQNTS